MKRVDEIKLEGTLKFFDELLSRGSDVMENSSQSINMILLFEEPDAII